MFGARHEKCNQEMALALQATWINLIAPGESNIVLRRLEVLSTWHLVSLSEFVKKGENIIIFIQRHIQGNLGTLG